jgi:hypothetical protein
MEGKLGNPTEYELLKAARNLTGVQCRLRDVEQRFFSCIQTIECEQTRSYLKCEASRLENEESRMMGMLNSSLNARQDKPVETLLFKSAKKNS